MTDQELAVCEALKLGLPPEIAARANELSLFEYYRRLRLGEFEPESANGEFRKAAKEAEAAGREYNGRLSRYREILHRHDEAERILRDRAERFAKLERDLEKGQQVALF